MSFTIKVKRKILKKAEKFPKPIRRKIEELIFVLKETPLPYLKFDLVKMEGYVHVYRIRIGKVRVIYRIDFKNKIIEILDCDYREKVY